eukprot:117911_1
MTTTQLIDSILQSISNNNTLHDDIINQTTDLTMDGLSIWIQNKQIIEQFNDEQLKFVQHDVINRVFGGLRTLLNMILDRLTLTMQHKLFVTLSDAAESLQITETNNNTKQIVIHDLPINIMSYTMRFLTSKDRYYSQQICRYFAIATRQKSAVNSIKELPMIGIIPYKKKIIQCFSSENPNDNIKAINLCLQYRAYFPDIGSRSLLQKIFEYKENFYKQVEQVIIRTDSMNLFCREYTNLYQYYTKNLKRNTGSMIQLIQKMYNKWVNKHIRSVITHDISNEVLTLFVKRMITNNDSNINSKLSEEITMLFGVDINKKLAVKSEYKKWKEEYLQGNIDVVLYTYWTKWAFESCSHDYLLEEMCRKVVIPAYINAISSTMGPDYRQLVHCLTKDELKKVYELFKEVDYTEAKKLNKAFLNRNK